MSTLKVNAIEPYSGGTVTITGASIENATSASYAETANTLTAGDKTVNGSLNVNVGAINANNGVNVNTSPLNVYASIFLSGSNLIQKDGFPGQSAHIFQNENFFSEYYGTDIKWNAAAGEAQLACGALNKASLTANSFTPDFSTDNLINIQSTLANGTLFDDWSGTWMQVTEAGSPVMKRNLSVDGVNGTPGNTLEVKDGNGQTVFGVQNATLKGFTGVDIAMKSTAIDGSLNLISIGDYVDDAAAATGGVSVGGVYRTGNVLKIRVV